MILRTGVLTMIVAFSSSLSAATADDCIARYQELKSDFAATAPFAPKCARLATEYSLFSDSEDGQLPLHCDSSRADSGGWNHWHLEARAKVGKDSHCSLMLRGLVGQAGCGMEEEEVIPLPANEAVEWRRFLKDECSE